MKDRNVLHWRDSVLKRMKMIDICHPLRTKVLVDNSI